VHCCKLQEILFHNMQIGSNDGILLQKSQQSKAKLK